MALDFPLKLIMPSQNTAIFCRSSIDATRYLIKQKQPKLALQLSEILNGEPLPLNEDITQSLYQQSFFVDLEPEQVWDVVETLLCISQHEHYRATPGLVILAKSLYKDWMALAQSKGLVNK